MKVEKLKNGTIGANSLLKGIVIASIAVFCCNQSVDAQKKGNYGLSEPQSPNTLPVGKGKIDVPVRVNKVEAVAQLIKERNGFYTLNSGWELSEANKVEGGTQAMLQPNYNTINWYNATVPGTVLTTLVQQGIYPDPYIGLNNLSIPDDLCRKDWWYRIAFASPADAANRLAWLQFDGINYKAEVYLNGTSIGKMNGAFVHGNFDVTKLLNKSGKNVLAVHILPPPHPGIPHEESAIAGAGPNGGVLCLDGPTFISSEGWDWVPGIRDRNMGIWQAVHLKFTGAVTLQDPQVITDLPLPDTSYANVTVKAWVINNSTTPQSAKVQGDIAGFKFTQTVALAAGEKKQVVFTPTTTPVLNLKHPALWWPNGYGNQSLYQLKLSVTDNANIVADAQTVRFGVREFSYELMVNAPDNNRWRISYEPTNALNGKPIFDNINRTKVEGGFTIPSLKVGADTKGLVSLPKSNNPYLVIKVNGQKIFCKGGDWGMDDAMKRVERERMEPAFRLHKEANFNMVRNWTGECTEETFYELADEYGMLVWNDFWMSTEGYNLPPIDNQLMLDNVTDVVKRFRNHPSIAIWCPRNEGYAPILMEDKLAEILVTEDGTRHYNGNSREMNLRQSGKWNYFKDGREYYKNFAEGFSTEIGTFSVPVATTMKKFLKPEDQWPINDVWNYHDLHTGDGLKLKDYLNAVDSLYGKATSLEDFNKKVQLVNYESHRNIFEAWNSKLWKNCSGVLLWMTHPAWPSTIWQTYSWDYETHGAYYGSQKACEPLHIQMNLTDSKILAVNASLKSYTNVSVVLKVFSLEGKEIYKHAKVISVGADESVEAFKADLPTSNLPPVYLVKLVLENSKKEMLAENSYWKTNEDTKDFTSFNQLANVSLSTTKLSSEKGKTTIVLQNKTNITAIGIKLNLLDDNNNIVLPAYFSDGYFTLLPGEKKMISVSYASDILSVKIKVDGYNVNSTTISSSE